MNKPDNLYRFLFAVIILLYCSTATGQIIFVKHNAAGANNGTSWANAYVSLHDAITAAAPGNQIWVAKGTYRPSHDSGGNSSPGDPRTKTFFINKDIKIYGGFAGTETMLSQRNPAANPTILSGDLDLNDAANPAVSFTQIIGSNAYNVVVCRQVGNAARLDGLTITAGSNFGIGAGILLDGAGSGQFSDPTIYDCTISGNYSEEGGGLYCDGTSGGQSSPVVERCVFRGNRGEGSGGGLLSNGRFGGNSSPIIANCTFLDNSSRAGGALITTGYLGANNATIANCLFAGNYTTAFEGGAMYINYINNTIRNCTFVNNSAVLEAGAIYSEGGPLFIDNCIFWNNTSSYPSIYDFTGNTVVTYSLVQETSCNFGPNVTCGAGVIFNQDPLFVDAPAGNFRLSCNSPAINAGNNAVAPPNDLDGNPRPAGGTADMGAYEFSGSSTEYTAIGFNEVKMKKNTVQSGGVGVTGANKKVKLEHATMVTAANTFVRAPQLQLHGGSQVTTYYPGQVSTSLVPAFLPPNANCGNNLNIPDNSAPVTLNLACYGNITVGKNVTVTFSGHANINIKDLDIKEGATVLFAQNTTLRVNKKLDTGKNVTISNNGNTVWLFVDDQVKIDDGNNVAVNMYAKKNLLVKKTPTGNPTYMTGLFIAEKIDSKDNVFWNRDPAACPYSPPPLLLAVVLDFHAQATEFGQGFRVDLHWLTNTGELDERYEVEKSADGIHFQPIEAGALPRNDDRTHLYRDKDNNPEEGDWLYRLKITRRDGSTAYSEAKRVRIELPVDFTIFPNPASSRVNIYMERFLGREVEVVIANLLGQVVYKQHIAEVVYKLLPIEMDGNTFRDGLYTVSVVHGGRAHTLRLVVAK